MFKKLQIILLSIFFGGALGFFMYQEEKYFFVLGFLVLLNLLLVWPLAKRLRFLAIPFFMSIGALNLLYLVDGFYERISFSILATIVYGLSLWGAHRLKKYDCDQTAQGMINLATIVTVFFWFVSEYGWYLNFDIDSWVLVVGTIVSTFFIILPSLTICFVACYKIHYRQDKKKSSGMDFVVAFKHQLKVQRVALFFSFIIAFIMGEVIWGLSFWPFGHLTTGMTAVTIFFLLWTVIRRFIQRQLTKRFIIVNVGIMIVLIVIMIMTSPWNIIE